MLPCPRPTDWKGATQSRLRQATPADLLAERARNERAREKRKRRRRRQREPGRGNLETQQRSDDISDKKKPDWTENRDEVPGWVDAPTKRGREQPPDASRPRNQSHCEHRGERRRITREQNADPNDDRYVRPERQSAQIHVIEENWKDAQQRDEGQKRCPHDDDRLVVSSAPRRAPDRACRGSS